MLKMSSITEQSSILSRFDVLLLRCVVVDFYTPEGSPIFLYGDRKKLYKLGFSFSDSDEFLPDSEIVKLKTLPDEIRSSLSQDIRGKQVLRPTPLLEAFVFEANSKNRPSFFTFRPAHLEHAIHLSLAVSTACEVLSLPLFGTFQLDRVYRSTVIKKGSQSRGPLVHHYLSCFKNLSIPHSFENDSKMIKLIKNSFHRFLVRCLHQYQVGSTRPVVPVWPEGPSFSIIPCRSWSRMKKEVLLQHPGDEGPRKLIQLAYSISQSKSLCRSVSPSFVQMSLESHKNSLCLEETRSLSAEVLSVLKNLGEEFGKVVADYYHPFRTVLPNSSACYEYSRRKGGVRQFVEDKFSSHPNLGRCEPLVIGLFGPPGSGKSLLTNQLIGFCQREFGIQGKFSELAFYRNPHSDHWDGYTGQFIVVIDDFGQDLVSSPDIREFDQMVSCGTFYPPMASLQSKGIEFSSKIVILTSNLTFGQRLVDPSGKPILIDPLSVWRRIHLPFLVLPPSSISKNPVLRSLGVPFEPLPHYYSEERTDLDVREHIQGFSFVDYSSPAAVSRDLYMRHRGKTGGHLWTEEEDPNLQVESSYSRKRTSLSWSPRIFSIFPDTSVQVYSHGICSGYPASELSHLPDDLYQESHQLEVAQMHQNKSTLVAPSGDYNYSDPRNKGLQTLQFDIQVSNFSELSRNLIDTFYLRENKFYSENCGVWPQSVLNESVECHSFGDEAEPQVYLSRVRTSTSIELKKVYYFPSSPPDHPPLVRAEAIPEPLKCRVITIPEGSTFCLKPLQMAMHRALSVFPQFSLTHSAYFNHEFEFCEAESTIAVQAALRRLSTEFLSRDELNCLSGDYEGATDNFIMDVSRTLMRAILRYIPHLPTREWAMWELSPARIRYPSGTYLQTRGQRMGSLLSFPLLCLANEALCRLCSFHPGSYLINGDDLAAGVTDEQHDAWRTLGRQIGLIPNQKYFYSSGRRKFVLINSQFFDVNSHRTIPSGKLSCMVRRDFPLAYCLEYLQRYYGTNLLRSFMRINKFRLTETPRSPCVPVCYGGLGGQFESGFDLKLAVRVYLVLLNKHIWRTPMRIPGTSLAIISVPCTVQEMSFVNRACDMNNRILRSIHERSAQPSFGLQEHEIQPEIPWRHQFLLEPTGNESYRFDLKGHLYLVPTLGRHCPWSSELSLPVDELAKVFSALCTYRNMDGPRLDGGELFQDFTWDEFRHRESSIKFSESHLASIRGVRRLFELPRISDYFTRLMVVPVEYLESFKDLVWEKTLSSVFSQQSIHESYHSYLESVRVREGIADSDLDIHSSLRETMFQVWTQSDDRGEPLGLSHDHSVFSNLVISSLGRGILTDEQFPVFVDEEYLLRVTQHELEEQIEDIEVDTFTEPGELFRLVRNFGEIS